MTGYCTWKEYDFYGDAIDLARLFKDRPYFFFLDSSAHSTDSGRFSYIGCEPFYVFSNTGRNSLPELKRLFGQYAYTKEGVPPFFHGGLIGYLSYDFGFHLEDIKRRIPDDLCLPECFFGFYDSVIAVDHRARKR